MYFIVSLIVNLLRFVIILRKFLCMHVGLFHTAVDVFVIDYKQTNPAVSLQDAGDISTTSTTAQ